MTAELVAAPSVVEGHRVIGGVVLPAVASTSSTDVAQVSAAWLSSRRSPHTRRAYTADLDGWLR